MPQLPFDAQPHELATRDSGSAPVRKPACDRCRGQKLRCVWDVDSAECRRCAKAGAICAAAPSRPMGRPSKKMRLPGASRSENHPSPSDTEIPNGDLSSSTPAQECGGSADGVGFQDTLHNMLLDPLLSGFLGDAPGLGAGFDAGHVLGPPSAMLWEPDGLLPSSDTVPAPATTHARGGVETQASPGSDSTLASQDAAPPPLAVIDQLSKMNMALYEHISQLNGVKLDASSQIDSASVQHSTMQLGIGRLVSITHEFKALADRLGLQLPGTGDGSRINSSVPCDQATGLVLLSCYLRLKQAQGQTLVMLRDLDSIMEKHSTSGLAPPQILPGLVIDGFPLAGHPQLQVKIAKQLCESSFGIIGSIPVLEGHMGSVKFMDWSGLGDCLERLRELP